MFGSAQPQRRELRKLVEEAAPEAESSLKWGMPHFTLHGAMMCALGAHRSHVNLILAGPPDAFSDPERRLSGEGKTGRHLKLTTLDELPRESVRRWLRTAAEIARRRHSVARRSRSTSPCAARLLGEREPARLGAQ